MALINDFMSLIYPRRCEACGILLFLQEEYICNLCSIGLPRSNYHKNTDNELTKVFAGRIPFKHVMSYFIFEKSGRVQHLLHQIKYQNQKELAFFLGQQYAKELIQDKFKTDFDLIVPIPLHKNKLKSRGFNQSEWFAKGLSETLNILVDITSMIRHEETATQTKKKKYERWENVEGIFLITNKSKLKGKHVVLVDDVITTGATIEAAWQALKDIEGVKISVIALAFAARNF
ncbi:MAG: ComF family protein [Bacteroidetes bacterium]|nr:ComF family protein [Bacteroidota bacterium]